MKILNFTKEDYLISTDKSKLQLDVIHKFLSNSYWAKGISRNKIEIAIENSYCFGVFKNKVQIGFARVITDYSTFAYLKDVFILEQYRKLGLSKWLMEIIMNSPDLINVNAWMLKTADAHGLYNKFGFNTVEDPERIMTYSKS